MSEAPIPQLDPQRHWKKQPMTTIPIDLGTLRARERRLDRATARRDRREYLAGGLAALVLLAASIAIFLDADSLADTLMATGFLALVLGLAFSGLHLSRASRGHGDVAASGVEHLVRRLGRERDLLRSAWLWYVGPLLPGFLLVYGAAVLAGSPFFAAIAGGSTLAFLLLVVVLNRRAAARLEREISALRAACGEAAADETRRS